MKKNKNYSLKLFSIVMSLLFIFNMSFGSVWASNVVENTQEQVDFLTNVITGIRIYDNSNGREATKEVDGTYRLVQTADYSFEVSFDLSSYNDVISDGDYFDFDIPAKFDVKSGQKVFFEEKGIRIAVGETISNGKQLGGKVRVILQNLEDYKEKNNVDVIKDIKGSFFVKIDSTDTVDKTDTSFKNIKDKESIDISYKIDPKQATDYSETVKVENLAKIGGVVQKSNIDSPILGLNGEVLVHTWTIRVNASKKDYSNSLFIIDEFMKNKSPMKAIPETLIVEKSDAYSTNSFQLVQPIEILKENIDYRIEYYPGYKGFKLEIFNPGNSSYRVRYSSTSPGDGTDVGNKVELVYNDTIVKPNDNRNNTYLEAVRSSKLSEGGNITLNTAYKVLLYKTDASTGDVMEGVEFELISKESNEVLQTLKTDENGRAISGEISPEYRNKVLIIREKAVKGYKKALDQEVVIGEKGAIFQIENERKDSGKVSLSVKKVLEGKELKNEQFTFELVNEQNEVIQTKTNDEAGNVQFDEISYNEEGTHNYTIREKKMV